MGIPYTVFVDESFDGFMNLPKNDGYFCYAAIMVPSSKLTDLERFWSTNRERLITAYKEATGFTIRKEFKSGYLNKIDFHSRKFFADRLNYFLSKNHCFVAGFYTRVKNLLMYHLRTDVAKDDQAVNLPVDWLERLPSIKQKLIEDKLKQPGDSFLLMGLLHQTLSITLNWLGSGGHPFNMVYDPRQKQEDTFLIRYTDDWLARESELKKFIGIYQGGSASLRSSDSPGLMLADLILRDIRFLFEDVPELLEEQSSPKLILPVPQGYEPVVMPLKGLWLKWGDRHPMSANLIQKIARPTQNSMLPIYASHLAGHKLSCEAVFGESRVINFSLGCFEDMVD